MRHNKCKLTDNLSINQINRNCQRFFFLNTAYVELLILTVYSVLAFFIAFLNIVLIKIKHKLSESFKK